MVRLIIAGPVYVEYEASPLEYQVEDNLAKIGTALGPAEITDTSPLWVECYRKSVKKVNGLHVLLYKGIEIDKEHSPISLSDLLRALSNDKRVDQMLILQKKLGDELGIGFHKGESRIECDGANKQLVVIEEKLNKFVKESHVKDSMGGLYKTAIKAIPKLSK